MRCSNVGIFACSLLLAFRVEAKEWREYGTAFSPDMYESGGVMEKIMESKMVSENIAVRKRS
jgi:hypothetical protein